MARHFAELKLALLANGFRVARRRAVAFALALLAMIPLALIGFSVLAAGGRTSAERAVAVLLFGGLFVGWSFIPLLGFGSDETLDPANLALLPLTSRQLVTGLTVASLVGIAPLGCVIVLLGALGGYGHGLLGTVLVIGAIAGEMLLCVVTGRAVVTSLSGLLRSRRGRDVTVTVVALLGIGIQLARFGLARQLQGRRFDESVALVRALRWTPPGFAARVMIDARAGRTAAALGALVVVAGCVCLAAWWWHTALARVLVTAESGTVRRGEGTNELFPGLFRFLPRNRTGAVAMKELRYVVREPRRRASIIPSVLLPLLPVISILQRGGAITPKLTLAALWSGFSAGLASVNQFGFDGGAFWLHVAAGDDADADLRGKNLAGAVIAIPLIVVSSLVLAALSGGWRYVPAVLLIATGMLGVLFGVGNIVSVRMPQPVPESRTNAWATRSGEGCVAPLLGMFALAIELVLLVPIGIGVAIGAGSHPPVLVLTAVLAPLYGAAVWTVGRRRAVAHLATHLPEMLERLSLRQAA